MRTKLQQRKADTRYKIMSKKTRRDASTFSLIGLFFIFAAGSLAMNGTIEEVLIGSLATSVALWAWNISYYELWYEKETIKRNSENELKYRESVV